MILFASPRRLAGVLLLGAALLSLGAAGPPVHRKFQLPGGDAAVTLKRFVRQSGEQVVYLVDSVRGVTTQAVQGEFTPRDALQRMLEGTPLAALEDARTGALTINRTGPFKPPARPAAALAPEVLQLSPFEVNVSQDRGYGALRSNSLTAFSMDLEKMPATAQVFTSTFIDDVAATSVQDVLVNYTGLVGADPNNGGAALNNFPGDRDGSGGNLGIRGLASAPPKRDGLVGPRTTSRTAIGYNDTFSVERIELVEGPQSLLYGAVGGGGVVNVVSKRPIFNWRQTTLSFRADQYGSRRAVLDTNQGTDRVAVRVAALAAASRTVRENIGNDDYGLYVALGFRPGRNVTVRLFHELTDSRGNVNFTPGSGDLGNFFYLRDAAGKPVRDAAGLPVLNPADPRRGQDVRYLALTGQLADLQGVLWDGPVDYNHIGSAGAWWSSEYIRNDYNGLTIEGNLPGGLAAQLTAIYSETADQRATVGKNLVPAAGFPGAGANPLPETAVRLTPGLNYQGDRTRGVRLNLLHTANFKVWRLEGRSQTVFGGEWGRQWPAFASGGIDELYYQADANWNVLTNPAIASDYGRIPLGALYFGVQHAVPAQPLFRPGTARITLGGQNYVLQPRIRRDPARVSATNPLGFVPNNPTAANPEGFAGNWNLGGDTHSQLLSLANYTEWWDGRLTTLVGASVNRFDTTNAGPGFLVRLEPRDYWGYQYGANYALRPGLRLYAAVSTSALAAGTTRDLYGVPLRVPKAVSPAPEVGLKFKSADDRYSVLLSCNLTTKVENETRNVGLDFFNAVNPDGINGRYNAGDQWINLDRKSASTELVVTARPTADWRLRLSAVRLDGEVTSTVSYRQLYNDQFRTNGSNVVYADGTPVLVDAVTGAPVASGGTPLTLAMINDPASVLYAAPNADSGSITGVALRTALGPHPLALAHGGAAATGVAGLPFGARQYQWANAGDGVITVVRAGDRNTGINEYACNFQSNYAFSTGRLKGFGVFTSVRAFARNRAYYALVFPATGGGTSVRAERVLYRLPGSTVVDLNFSYRRTFHDRYEWSTQLNINNVFDRAEVTVAPNPANAAQPRARLSALPRQFIWTNSLRF
ncbi:MAG TPA: TonB-dependent receptor plug domain-containing protein [Lacunisphaera sp.]|nr:TonB-dependent receptor plug domain-containing protein [Lacunisphaera sp.]